MSGVFNPYKANPIRTFEVKVYVNGYVEGGLADWPANVQDAIYEALEKKSDEVQLPLTVVHSYCDIDHGEAMDGSQDRFFLHVIASEIVVAPAHPPLNDAQALYEAIKNGKVH